MFQRLRLTPGAFLSMKKPVSLLIDGGFLRVQSRKAGKIYNPDFIESFAHACIDQQAEETIRILYYDCAPFSGELTLPVSGQKSQQSGSAGWLQELSRRNLFALRMGVLKFRGFRPKRTPVAPGGQLTDADFEPIFEQKGVDMRIGLDIANYAANRAVQRIILVTNDTDCVPAMKYGRRAGLQVAELSL